MTTDTGALERTLREVCEHLAPVDTAGVQDVALEDEPSWGPFPPTVATLEVLGAVGAGLVVAGRRLPGALVSLVSIAGVFDETENGPRVVRRALRRRKTTVNVIARAGDPTAERTLVLMAHHDAAQTGRIFDQGLQKKLNAQFPGVLQRFKTQPPQWWIGVAGQLGALIGAATGRRAPAAAAGFATYLIADIMHSPTVPGANDNLSGVAATVALAELLRTQPISGLKVLLLSAGAEETLQDGIRGFIERHPSGR